MGKKKHKRPQLNGVSEIRAYLRTNQTPVYFISPTAFNLMGLDRWVQNLYYVTYFDSYEGGHPRVFVPSERDAREFNSMEEICNYLLGHKQVIDFIHGHGPTGKACFVMFDERTEELAADAGLEVIHPTAKLRGRLDSKIVTTKIGNRARVPSVPNVLARADSYADLKKLAADAGLGDRLVVQTPYGDSGRTTYFINSSGDWDKHSKAMAGQAAQSDETHSTAGGVRGGGHHKVRNAGGTIRRLTRWLSRVDAVCGRLVRERHLSGGAHRKAAKEGVQDDATAGRRTRERGIQGLLRSRLPGRCRHRRAVSRRAEPPGVRARRRLRM